MLRFLLLAAVLALTLAPGAVARVRPHQPDPRDAWVLTAPPGEPTPDPYPGTGTAPVTYVPYSYVVPAVNVATGQIIPGLWFRCDVAATGSRTCKPFHR